MQKKTKSILLAFMVSGASFAQDIHGIDVKYMDQTVRPQDDFYEYVNGTWLKETQIPADKSRYGSFDQLSDETDLQVNTLMGKLLKGSYKTGSDNQKIVSLYNSYTNFSERDKVGLAPILPYLKKIDDLKSVKDLEKYLIETTPIFGNPLYGFYIEANMKNSGENVVYLNEIDAGLSRAYYQDEDAENTKALDAYAQYLQKLDAIFNLKSKSSKEVIEFEKSTVKLLLTQDDLRDAEKTYNPVKLNDLAAMVKNVDLTGYLKTFGLKPNQVFIGELNYYKNLDNIINEKNIPILKEYLKFQLINDNSKKLTSDLDQVSFNFYGAVLRGQKEQRAINKRGLDYVNGNVGQLVGKIYVQEYFPAQAKQIAKEMIDYLFKSYKNHIQNLTWMSADTKVKALDKLNHFTIKIGYPDKWKDYSQLNISDNLFQNEIAIHQWRFKENLAKYGKPVDRSEWHMNPQTVNAYYNPSNNEIVFPAAILQAPFYDYKADAAVNFGAIGAVIGHEITHGFDDSGAQYDSDGNFNNWWTEKDKAAFDKVANALADEYSAQEVKPGVFIKGKFTLGENIADLGGLAMAYDALQLYLKDKGNPGKIDGFTPDERFFMSWTTIYRGKITDAALINQVKTDPHSPAYYRAIIPLINTDAWYKTFDVKTGDKLFKSKDKRIIIW